MSTALFAKVIRGCSQKRVVSCEESYCTVHIIPHLENAVLRQHVLVSPMGDTGRLCKEHGKEQELYCEPDETPLCAYCMLPAEAKHGDGHNVVIQAEALDTLRGRWCLIFILATCACMEDTLSLRYFQKIY